MKHMKKLITLALVVLSVMTITTSALAARMYADCSTSSSVNIRSGPGTTYSRVGTLRNGEPVQTTGAGYVNGYVPINQPRSGWVSSSYLSSSMPSWWNRYGDVNMNDSSGTVLEHFQHDLNEALNLDINENGVWGTQTRNAVKKLQAEAGLTVDGIAGTYTKLWTYNLSH